jgi:hypothetical protein
LRHIFAVPLGPDQFNEAMKSATEGRHEPQSEPRYQPPTPADELLSEFWRLEKEAEALLKGLAQ